MSRIKISDGSTWPRPALESDDSTGLYWKLVRMPFEGLSQEDLTEAASIISAYGYLVAESTQEKRDLVCREIRQALREEE